MARAGAAGRVAGRAVLELLDGVDRDPGKRAMSLMTSSTSLTGSTATGATAPVNLGLAPDAGGFAPISAPVRVQIPGSTSAPVVFPSGVRVDLPHTRSGVSAMLSNDHAFYGAASTDEDVAVNAVPQGAELSLILRSPAAATTVPLAFALPSGASMRLAGPFDKTPQPPGSVAIEQAGHTIGVVLAASGADAQGRPVGVGYSLKDPQTLMMHVKLPANVAFPALVDPSILDTFPQPGQPTVTGSCWNGWNFFGSGGATLPLVFTPNPTIPESLFISTGPNAIFLGGSVGECFRTPPRTATSGASKSSTPACR